MVAVLRDVTAGAYAPPDPVMPRLGRGLGCLRRPSAADPGERKFWKGKRARWPAAWVGAGVSPTSGDPPTAARRHLRGPQSSAPPSTSANFRLSPLTGARAVREKVSKEASAPRSFPEDSYLVDPASSHMLVSKIKPCMSKYKQ